MWILNYYVDIHSRSDNFIYKTLDSIYTLMKANANKRSIKIGFTKTVPALFRMISSFVI